MTSQCSSARLEEALAGSLPPGDEASLCRHLEECEECSAAMERLAGGASWCREAAALLTGDALDDAVPVRDAWSEVDFTVEHLEPTDEPNVLGRLGGYDVLEILGRGGMGVVLKGYDRELKRCVAIKVLAPHLAHSSLARRRFAREAQAAAAVVHANVLAIHQVQASGRLPFLVMPLVAGESLGERLAAKGTLELKEILRIGMQAAAGLAAAHEQGLVHRDVKPANILLEKGVERAVLTDFGLACAADDVALTQWGIVAGTPQYMSPEQARGEPLDGRSDLFSLGCVLYEMATGVSPFKADSTMATMRRLVEDAPQAMASLNPELPPWFIAIVGRLLEKDPARRFGSAKEVSELLESCLAHLQQPASVPLPAALSMAVPLPEPGRRKSRFKGVLAMFAVIGTVLLGAFGWMQSEPPDIAGQWQGDEWGTVILKKTNEGEYAGTYTDTFGKKPGEIKLKWSRIERRFNGTWREGQALAFSPDAKTLAAQTDRFGELSVRFVNNEIRGAFTTDRNSAINPATPRMADLAWTRDDKRPPDKANAKSDRVSGPTPAGTLTPDLNMPVLPQAKSLSAREKEKANEVAVKQAAVTLAEEQKGLAESKQKLAQAAVRKAQISFFGWETEVKRVTRLLSDHIVGQSVVDEASRERADAKASWEKLSAEFQLAGRELNVAVARLQLARAELAEAESRQDRPTDKMTPKDLDKAKQPKPGETDARKDKQAVPIEEIMRLNSKSQADREQSKTDGQGRKVKEKANEIAVKRATVTLAEEQKGLAESNQKLAQAAIAKAKADVLRWEPEIERAAKLVAQRIYDQATFDEVKSHSKAAKASLAEAEAKLQVAEREVRVAHARLQLAQAELAEAEGRHDRPAEKAHSSEDLEKANVSFQAEYAAAQLVLLGHFDSVHADSKIDFVIEYAVKSHEILKSKTKLTLPNIFYLEGLTLPQRLAASKTRFILFCDVNKDKIDCRKAMPLADADAVSRALHWIKNIQEQLDKERSKAGGTETKADGRLIGIWQLKRTQKYGKDLAPARDEELQLFDTLTFTNKKPKEPHPDHPDELEVSMGSHKGDGTCYLDPKSDPSKLTMRYFLTYRCIYRVEKDTLTICCSDVTNTEKPRNSYPERFETAPGSERVLRIYQRVPEKKTGEADAIKKAAPAQMPVPTLLGPKAFRDGDVVEITDVRATSLKLEQGDSVTIRGRVRLASQAQAQLCLFLTQTTGDGGEEVDLAQTVQVKRGVSDFELKATIKHRGFLHLTLYDQSGNPLGGVYFGTAPQMKEIEGWSLDYYLQEQAPPMQIPNSSLPSLK